MRTFIAVALLGLLTAAASAYGHVSSVRPAKTSVRCAVRAHLTAPLNQGKGGLLGTLSNGIQNAPAGPQNAPPPPSGPQAPQSR